MPEEAAKVGERKPKQKTKQAVVVIHGMGEQIPMQTLRSFVDAVWASDRSLISRNRPDSDTGELPRKKNPVWEKPDRRNRTYELRRVTTETPDGGKATDFYEFYWAHLIQGTTWDQLTPWIGELMLRRWKRVPHDVRGAWIVLWAIAIIIGLGIIYALLPQWILAGLLPAALQTSRMTLGLAPAILAAIVYIGLLVARRAAGGLLLSHFGDVARYVKARPANVASRQQIREKGVELLETLMGLRESNTSGDLHGAPAYDRIIVVAHSLGCIVAYDILKHAFARINATVPADDSAKQPARDALEAYLRQPDFDLETFRKGQAACRDEMNAQGNPWIVSDFITLGCPLTHAEFLLAEDETDLREQQQARILPTCPPTLELDRKTKERHFTFWVGSSRKGTQNFRYPHHAAHFAYTRWTNLYSKSRWLLWGDIISGPVGDLFSLRVGDRVLKGIKDIAVLPARDSDGKPLGRVPFFTHVDYWNMDARTSPQDDPLPHHIRVLREVLDLGAGTSSLPR